MKIALLADVHGNLPALDALIRHALEIGVDEYWNLGDMVAGGPHPNECVSRLRAVAKRHIAGNHDVNCAAPEHQLRPRPPHKDPDKAFSFQWTRRELTPDSAAFIQQLSLEDVVCAGGYTLWLMHGAQGDLTPRSPAEKFRAMARDARDKGASLVLCGHTHEFFDKTFDGVRFVNPGCAGRSFDGDIRAAYCVLELGSGYIRVDSYRIAYDQSALVSAMQERSFSPRLIRSFTEARSLKEVDGLHMSQVDAFLQAALSLGNDQHAVEVARLAVRLFDELKPLHGLGWKERVLLNAAALLHDIGMAFGPESHHKASRDMILQDKTLGLEHRDRVVLALVARYHRRSLPSPQHKYFQDLSFYDQEIVAALAALLRIADGLDRGHQDNVKDVRVEYNSGRVLLKAIAEQGRLIKEELRAAQEKADLLAQWFGVEVVVTGQGS